MRCPFTGGEISDEQVLTVHLARGGQGERAGKTEVLLGLSFYGGHEPIVLALERDQAICIANVLLDGVMAEMGSGITRRFVKE